MPRRSNRRQGSHDHVNRRVLEKVSREALLALEGYGGPFLEEEKQTMLRGLEELEKRFLDEGEMYISWQIHDLVRLVGIIGPEGVHLLVESFYGAVEMKGE